MIYLNCEVKSGLGEDTFWTWFQREFPTSSFETPASLQPVDILLRYSTLGFLPIEGKQVALCWELYPKMKEIYSVDCWDDRLKKVMETARYSTYRSVATKASVEDYSKFGSVNVIPIGVDTELFSPISEKDILRNKYNLPLDKQIGIWIGTIHPMKGLADLQKYALENPDVVWIMIWKWEFEQAELENAFNFVKIPQQQIAELMSCADFFAVTSRLSSYYMSEWEAMSCDVPFRFLNDVKREFIPTHHPREDVFRLGWDRQNVKKTWEIFLFERGIEF